MLIALFSQVAPLTVIWHTAHLYSLLFMQTILKIDYVTVYWIMTVALFLATPFL